MKKKHLLVGLGISISLLTACQNSNSSSNSATTEAETNTQTTVAPKPMTDYTLYNSVLEKYKELLDAESKHLETDYTKNINYLAKTAKSIYDSPGIIYTLYDFDKNNVDELVISLNSDTDNYEILDIYTISNGKVIRLTNKDNKLDNLSALSHLYMLEDGTFSYLGYIKEEPHYVHYKITGDALEVIKEGSNKEITQGLSPKLSLNQLDWKPTQWFISSPNKHDTFSRKKLDIKGIKNGDYSSLKGTWVDGLGHTLIFDENGLVDENYEMNLSYFKEYKGTLIGGYGPKNSPVGGAAVYIIPGGVPMTDNRSGTFQDPIQTDKDRIFAGQHFPRFANEFYYKIDD